MTEVAPATWWQITLAVLTALGTVGAVLAALIVAAADRRAADRRAEEDRLALAQRDREERAGERRAAHARWKLDLLLQLSAAHEILCSSELSHPMASRASLRDVDRAHFQSLLRAYPDPLPLLRQVYLREDPPEAFDPVFIYGGPPIDRSRRAPTADLERREIDHAFAAVRRELLGTSE